MKIVHVVGSFFPEAKGACYSAVRLVHGLRDLGVESSFVTNDATGWLDGEAYEGFPVRTYFLKGTGKLKKAQSLLRLIYDLQTGRIPCDLVHFHGGGHMHLIAARLIQLFVKKPTLFKITLNGWDSPDGIRRTKWARMALRSFMSMDAVVAMTSGQAELCRQEGYTGNLEVIPNGVDCVRFKPALKEEREKLRLHLGMEEGDFVLCYTGVLNHRKGTDLLLKLMSALKRRRPECVLYLVGDFVGGQREEMARRQLAADLGVDPDSVPWDRIRFLGRVDNVEDYMRAADLFVFPSRQEGFGTVQIEAMACGLPCLVYDIPGVSADIFPDESVGIRLQAHDVDIFKEKVLHLMDSAEERQALGERARSYCLEHFDRKIIAEQYRSLYCRLMDNTVT
jgi:glycosyltransferase involved in cell wall biosynthesis